ncbi:MAG: hypothetical protein HRU49_14285 [Winogradskyella sp.]|uniref:hypothetical protein n=1 Tax=Winogradskyella sp. TaxID=1883156 RepID=UPI0025DB552F|nr:hypothetical protein [Winogradskyella sp.]NRB84916.1 hypothetical protein [Winogradskyella sp.]
MKKILNYIILGILVVAAYSCEEEATGNSVNYITFASEAESVTLDVGSGSGSTDILVYTGNKTGSDRTVNVMVADESTADPSGYSVPGSVTIPGGSNEGVLTVQLNESGLNFAPGTIVIEFMPNQGFVGTSGAVTLTVALVCPNANSSVDFVFDGYSEEIDWNITDSSGSVIASDAYGSDLDTVSVSACLIEGETYTWTINDSYGDGMSFPTDGNASITYNGNVLSSVSGNFGSQYVDTFTVPN